MWLADIMKSRTCAMPNGVWLSGGKHFLLLCSLLWALIPNFAFAATYNLPAGIGTSPFNNCTLQSGTTYTCTGSVTVGSNDTVNFTSAMTLSVANDFNVNNNATINGNGFTVTIIAGDDIDIGNSNTSSVNYIAGDDVKIGNSANVVGNISAGDDVEVGNNGTITGNVDAGDDLDVGSGSTIIGSCSYSSTNYTCVAPLAAAADYRFDECTQYTGGAGQVVDAKGSYPGTPMGSLQNATPGQVLRYADFSSANRYVNVPSGPAMGTNWTITAWFKTPFAGSGSHSSQYYVLGSVAGGGDFIYLDRNSSGGSYRWGVYNSGGTTDGSFRFGTLSNGWHHIALVGSGSNTRLYVDGVDRGQVARKVTGTFRYLGSSYDNAGTSSGQSFGTPLDEFKIFNSALTAGNISAIYSNELAGKNWDGTTRSNPCSTYDHLRIEHSGAGVTCTPTTLTIKACANSACSTLYGGGVDGTLTATGTPTVNWVGGSTFSIGASGSVTKDVQVTTAGSVTWGATSLSTVPSSGVSCYVGAGASCSYSSALSGFLFNVLDHVAETSQSVTVSAVKQADNSLSCVPAFASTSKSVTFSCSYTNPSSGTLPVRVGGAALNAANNSAAACDVSGRAVSLAFNSSGVATTSVQYADVGQMVLSASYAPSSGSEAGLVMTGSDSFVAAPASFAFSGVTASPIKAGSNFGATVTARNNAGNATPNFGKESSAEGVTLGFVKYQPTGAGAQNGSFSGSLGSFNLGAATGSNLNWSEVGTMDLTATLTSGSYLGSGLTATGNTGTTGARRFIPHHFTTSVTQGCDSDNFTYSAQPFVVEVRAWNGAATPATTRNYDGTAATSPNFAKAVTLTDANAGAAGTLSNASVAAADFSAGVATVSTPVYTFTSRTTNETGIVLRATESTGGDGVTSSGFTEDSASIRSGRMRLLNAYGSELLNLAVPLTTQYWSGGWVTNAADNCTQVPVPASGSGLVFGGGLVAGETTLSINGITSGTASFAAGNGGLLLTKPGVGNAGYVDITINAPDWLEFDWKGAGDVDPTGRATFGIYKAPVIYMRENY